MRKLHQLRQSDDSIAYSLCINAIPFASRINEKIASTESRRKTRIILILKMSVLRDE